MIRYQRIVVLGTSGSGKTTLAQQISRQMLIPHVELDALYWGPNWTESAPDVFQKRIDQATSGSAWVIDGDYSRVRDLVWQRADTAVWLDYPFRIVMWRLLKRTLRRVFGREALWGGNHESIRKAFFSKDSILLWGIQTYQRRKREYPELFKKPEYSHLEVIHLHSPYQSQVWLSTLTAL